MTMAVTGYFQDAKPILYDRGTESLWLEKNDALVAIAGTHHERRLDRIAQLVPVTWENWLSRNTEGRLIVGADRSQGIPRE
jgi:hypothetical protein